MRRALRPACAPCCRWPSGGGPRCRWESALDPLSTPVAACDFIERHDLRGRFFNHFEFGGYLLWRFWPQRDRLPFMDIHQSGTPRERAAYLAALTDPAGAHATMDTYGIDLALVKRVHASEDRLLDSFDADPAFAMVFVDDVAALYVRRAGRDSAAAATFAYTLVPGGTARLATLEDAVGRDSSLRQALRAELERMRRSSAANASAHSLLAQLDFEDARYEASRAHLEAARARNPLLPLYHARVAFLDDAQGRWEQAIDGFRRARAAGELPAIDGYVAPLYEKLGRRDQAHRAYETALRADPANAQLQQGLWRTADGR